MADRHFVKSQPVRAIKGKDRYWDWVEKHGHKNDDGELMEMGSANPDIFAEREDTGPSRAQLLMGYAISHLQGRQKEVYLLIYRYGKSISEAGEILGIKKSTAQIHKERAVFFITQYCQGVLANESE